MRMLRKPANSKKVARWNQLLAPLAADPVLLNTIFYGLGRGLIDLDSAEDLEPRERVKLQRMWLAWELLERLHMEAERQ